VRLTVCVDKVAASGGYMMAVVADTLIAAPFATVGSIGATTSVPVLNVGGFLKRVGIQAYTVKSGKKHFLIPSLPPSLPPSLLHTFIRL
jgi:serine protease SohB